MPHTMVLKISLTSTDVYESNCSTGSWAIYNRWPIFQVQRSRSNLTPWCNWVIACNISVYHWTTGMDPLLFSRHWTLPFSWIWPHWITMEKFNMANIIHNCNFLHYTWLNHKTTSSAAFYMSKRTFGSYLTLWSIGIFANFRKLIQTVLFSIILGPILAEGQTLRRDILWV